MRDGYKASHYLEFSSTAPVGDRKIFRWAVGDIDGVVWCSPSELESVKELALKDVEFIKFHSSDEDPRYRDAFPGYQPAETCGITSADDYPNFPNGMEHYLRYNRGDNLDTMQSPEKELAYKKEGEEHVLFLRARDCKGIESFRPGLGFEQRIPPHHEEERELIRSEDILPIAQYIWARQNFRIGWGFSTPGN